MHFPCFRNLRLRPLSILLWGIFPIASHAANNAEIVSLVGRGDARDTVRDDWRDAKLRQLLPAGSFVRTRDLSQMALLLQDQTQLRLNQNSMVQIMEVSSSGATTRLELTQGRVWAQAKRKGFSTDAATPPAVTVQTPNATAAIRGTDWELDVDKDGTATLTVLSGVVEFYNEFGRIAVLPNEQARAERGKAPTKMLLTNARERVQWVTAYRPQPRRWLSPVPAACEPAVRAIEEARYSDALALLDTLRSTPDAASAQLLRADLYLALGRVGEAVALLESLRDAPRAQALLARAYVIADRSDDAQRILAAALATRPDDIETWLAQGDLARFRGDVHGARDAYRRALAIAPANGDAWLGIGRIETEREAVRDGRAALERAIAADPDGPGYHGELATLESFANEFAAADQAFAAALDRHPDDYVALTGRGILQLKRSETDAALESFLKAGVVEPRYARGVLYTGVAYYQLGNYPRAMEMFGRAAELDPRDPLPHMMMSLAAGDRMELGEAVAEARRAAALMPYLKSANQLLNDQKGNANIGASLAQFGLEDWAQAYAHNSYTPYWAGSHLFLSDRYAGDFNKNSELFMGFLSDPTVFGASNRFNTLIASPGHYATVGGRAVNGDAHSRGMTLTANGYSVAAAPLAYFLAADPVRVRPDRRDMQVDADNYTIGLGMRPSHELALFVFGNRYGFEGRTKETTPTTFDATVSNPTHRLDLGASYKFSPTSQLWLKTGSGREESRFGGTIRDPASANRFNAALDTMLDAYSGGRWGSACTTITILGGCYSPSASIQRYTTRADQRDAQLRHSFDASEQWQVSWGLEAGQQDKPADILLSFPLMPAYAGLRLPAGSFAYRMDSNTRSHIVYLSNRFSPSSALTLQADLFSDRLRQRQQTDSLVDQGIVSGGDSRTDDRDIAEWNPRLGLSWQPLPGQTLRVAAQKWRRPASVNTLAPVDTTGIPVDDRLVALGGRLERLRVQYEWETNDGTFLQGFVDSKRVRNLNDSTTGPVSDFNLEDLRRLSSHNQLQPVANDLWEATPQFGTADINSAGVAVNQIMARNVTGSLRYVYSHSRNTGATFEGKEVPWLPRNLVGVGINWLPAPRCQLGATAVYRSRRYMDEANTQLLNAGWNLGLRGSWESADKHWSFEAVAANLHADKSSTSARSATLGAQVLYRF